MNDLNSILIEGNLTDDPVITGDVCKFTIESRRFFRSNESTRTESVNLEVITQGGLAERCYSALKKGQGCRVVGRLAFEVTLHIVAEHVEFKSVVPVKKSTSIYDRPAEVER